MQALLWPIVVWLLRTVVLQFIIMGICVVLVTQLMPVVLNYISTFVSPGGLTAVFSNIDPGVWYWLDFFALDYGLPLIISAYCARFLIRRIPFIG